MEEEAEILCLGNEILIGRTVNTNANYLATKLTRLGFKVTRITTVRDDVDVASSALQEVLIRKPRIVCISGGLGPTHDDIQLQVVGDAVNRELEINEHALSMISKKYEKMNDSRRKMALLPKGAKPLHNSQGSAPGVLTAINDTYIFSLPGVPREMKAIFEEEIVDIIEESLDMDLQLVEYNVDIRGARESDIAEITNKIREKYPKVGFKSHPKKDDEGYFLSLHTYMLSENDELVLEALEHWIDSIEEKYNIVKLTDVENYFKD